MTPEEKAQSRNRKRGLPDIRHGRTPDENMEGEAIRDRLMTAMEAVVKGLRKGDHPAWAHVTLALRDIGLRTDYRWWWERAERSVKSLLNDHLPLGSPFKLDAPSPQEKLVVWRKKEGAERTKRKEN